MAAASTSATRHSHAVDAAPRCPTSMSTGCRDAAASDVVLDSLICPLGAASCPLQRSIRARAIELPAHGNGTT